ncbi:glycosyltransferase [Macrococcus sp. EM39E]|uniref:glycosyltransferase n=1 Tax=Macrococcus animalis TaxID=3395467 RepID=UPI0039BE854B
MKVLVAADSIFYKTPDGTYWCDTIYDYQFWKRYLNVYNQITVISRTKKIDFNESEKLLKVSGDSISVIELPYMRKSKGYLIKYRTLNKIIKREIKDFEIAIFRLPSISATFVLEHYRKLKKPFIIEVVADPYEAYKGNYIAQKLFTKKLKKSVREANGVSYVTEKYLQSKYPSAIRISGDMTQDYFESYYSTIDLPERFFYKKNTTILNKDILVKFIHIANHINDMKGQKEAILVIKDLLDKGYKVELKIVGATENIIDYKNLVRELNLENSIIFTGLIRDKEELRTLLIDSDIMLFPSKAEGLPRVVIEAMACSLPVISTNVGGTPELLESNYITTPTDIKKMSDISKALIDDIYEYKRISERNYNKAMEYLNTNLEKKRNDFYRKLVINCDLKDSKDE